MRQRSVSTTPRSTAFTISYTVSPATAAAVSASISTPVLSTVRTRASTVTVDRFWSMRKLMSAPVMRSGWQRGISSGVRLAPMIPAVRATPRTSPFTSCPARTATTVAAFIFNVTRATASRTVSDLAETSTIRASPAGVRWERPRNAGVSRDPVMNASREPSGVHRGSRVANDELHPVLRDQLELLQLAHAPLLVWGEKASPVQGRQLFVVLSVLVVELLELVVFLGEPLDQSFGIGHEDLLAN